jgi:hypothetical protein
VFLFSAARCLLSLTKLINQCIGDAISDLLLVEVALYHVSLKNKRKEKKKK